jgi:hypothetical protein
MERSKTMNEKEFFEWLETCPTHKWEVNHAEEGGCMVIFRWCPDEETTNDKG